MNHDKHKDFDFPKNVRVNIYISESLLEKIDNFAKKHYVSRSAFFTYASMSILYADEVKAILQDTTDLDKL